MARYEAPHEHLPNSGLTARHRGPERHLHPTLYFVRRRCAAESDGNGSPSPGRRGGVRWSWSALVRCWAGVGWRSRSRPRWR